MEGIISILVALVALLHLYFLYFEMFAWETTGRKLFRRDDPAFFKKTKAMAANQGLYNGFLAAGLLWSFFIENEAWREHILCFFLGCVIVAGLFGAVSVSKKIFYIQAVPAILALVLLLLT